MTLTALANLSAAELKDRKDEALATAKETPVDELAARTIQFLIDAKMRDERLAEQGKLIAIQELTINSLNNDLVMATEIHRKELAEATAANESLQQARDLDAATIATSHACIEKQDAQHKALGERCNRLAAEARRNNAALFAAAKMLNEAIAAQTVDAANNGE